MLITHCFSCCYIELTLSEGLCSFPCSASSEVHKELAGDADRAADPDLPKGYSTAHDIVLSI